MSDPKNPWELPIHDPSTSPSIEMHLFSLFPSSTLSWFHLSVAEILTLPENARDTLARATHVSCWDPPKYHVMGCTGPDRETAERWDWEMKNLKCLPEYDKSHIVWMWVPYSADRNPPPSHDEVAGAAREMNPPGMDQETRERKVREILKKRRRLPDPGLKEEEEEEKLWHT